MTLQIVIGFTTVSYLDARRYAAQYGTCQVRLPSKFKSHRSDLNRRPLDYESRALPLSYGGGRPLS